MLLYGIERSSGILLHCACTEEVCCAASEAVCMESPRRPCSYSTFADDLTCTELLHELGRTTTYGDVLLLSEGLAKTLPVRCSGSSCCGTA